jgi:hypothetical protein
LGPVKFVKHPAAPGGPLGDKCNYCYRERRDALYLAEELADEERELLGLVVENITGGKSREKPRGLSRLPLARGTLGSTRSGDFDLRNGPPD